GLHRADQRTTVAFFQPAAAMTSPPKDESLPRADSDDSDASTSASTPTGTENTQRARPSAKLVALAAAAVCVCRTCWPCIMTSGLLYMGWKKLKSLRNPSPSVPATNQTVAPGAPHQPRSAAPGAPHQPRSDAEVEKCVEKWKELVHPRAREFLGDGFDDVLTDVAKFTDTGKDPVLGGGCCQWHGRRTKGGNAALGVCKPGDARESITYLNRLLAFGFATDESFEKLMKLPKEPFKMTCNDQLCVSVSCIGVAVVEDSLNLDDSDTSSDIDTDSEKEAEHSNDHAKSSQATSVTR
ncbi:unnamed protein product, partial [Symbiodinium sp. CCMP2456]